MTGVQTCALPILSIPACIEFREAHNWNTVGADCRKLVLTHAPRFCALMGQNPLSPLTEAFIGQMFSIPVKTSNPLELKRLLYHHYRIEIPVTEYEGRYCLRYSIQGFNSQKDLNLLFEAMEDLLRKGILQGK